MHPAHTGFVCTLCVEIQKGNLTALEAARAIGEVKKDAHAEQIVDLCLEEYGGAEFYAAAVALLFEAEAPLLREDEERGVVLKTALKDWGK